MVISENTIEELSFDEVFSRYQKLIDNSIRSYQKSYDKEELYQIASMALWKAFEKYDIDKYPVAFGYYARLVISSQLNHYHRDNKKHEVVTKSLNTVIKDSENFMEFIDTLIDETDYEELAVNNAEVDRILKVLDEVEKICLMEYVCGKSQSQIAKVVGLSQQVVSLRIIKAKNKLRAAV
jgi:RNA polymerase sigma factor (sigma-70 family)